MVLGEPISLSTRSEWMSYLGAWLTYKKMNFCKQTKINLKFSNLFTMQLLNYCSEQFHGVHNP